MNDELSTNERMKRVLAMEPVISPPKGYPGRKDAISDDTERDFRLWEQRIRKGE
jgi:hypothetical protein